MILILLVIALMRYKIILQFLWHFGYLTTLICPVCQCSTALCSLLSLQNGETVFCFIIYTRDVFILRENDTKKNGNLGESSGSRYKIRILTCSTNWEVLWFHLQSPDSPEIWLDASKTCPNQTWHQHVCYYLPKTRQIVSVEVESESNVYQIFSCLTCAVTYARDRAVTRVIPCSWALHFAPLRALPSSLIQLFGPVKINLYAWITLEHIDKYNKWYWHRQSMDLVIDHR